MASSGAWENVFLIITPTLMVYVEYYALQFWMNFLPNFDMFVIFIGFVFSQTFLDRYM